MKVSRPNAFTVVTFPGSGFSGAFASRQAAARRNSRSEVAASPASSWWRARTDRARTFSSPG